MSDAYRNIADVIDHIQTLEGVYVTRVDHTADPESSEFALTVEVPQYERLSVQTGEDTAFCSNVLCRNPVVVPAGHDQGDGFVLCEECEAPERP